MNAPCVSSARSLKNSCGDGRDTLLWYQQTDYPAFPPKILIQVGKGESTWDPCDHTRSLLAHGALPYLSLYSRAWLRGEGIPLSLHSSECEEKASQVQGKDELPAARSLRNQWSFEMVDWPTLPGLGQLLSVRQAQDPLTCKFATLVRSAAGGLTR